MIYFERQGNCLTLYIGKVEIHKPVVLLEGAVYSSLSHVFEHVWDDSWFICPLCYNTHYFSCLFRCEFEMPLQSSLDCVAAKKRHEIVFSCVKEIAHDPLSDDSSGECRSAVLQWYHCKGIWKPLAIWSCFVFCPHRVLSQGPKKWMKLDIKVCLWIILPSAVTNIKNFFRVKPLILGKLLNSESWTRIENMVYILLHSSLSSALPAFSVNCFIEWWEKHFSLMGSWLEEL